MIFPAFYDCPVEIKFSSGPEITKIKRRLDEKVTEMSLDVARKMEIKIDEKGLCQALTADKKRYEEAFSNGYVFGSDDANVTMVWLYLTECGVEVDASIMHRIENSYKEFKIKIQKDAFERGKKVGIKIGKEQSQEKQDP